ncbi:MAG: sigma-70 family RNA polymerase sigma factor [Dysosmobacter sp.]|nr:sigma-70 family RNA polymerase sigma factor [Dysosmobacter sp.]
METIPRDLDEWRQFDRYCKLVLKHEAIDYLREQKHRRDHETTLSAVPKAKWDKLCTVDSYPSDSFVFSAHGCSLPISNEQVAEAFASLSTKAQSILILRFALDLTDKEIGVVMGLSRSTVQEHRQKTLEILRAKLAALMPEGGKE